MVYTAVYVMCFKYFAVWFNHPRTKTSSLRNLGSWQRGGKTKGCRRERNNGAAIFKGIIYGQEHHVTLLSLRKFFPREKATSECDWSVMTSVFVVSQSHFCVYFKALDKYEKAVKKTVQAGMEVFKIQARMWRSLFLCSESYIFLSMNLGQGHRKAVETYNASQRKWVDDMVSACSVCFFTRI